MFHEICHTEVRPENRWQTTKWSWLHYLDIEFAKPVGQEILCQKRNHCIHQWNPNKLDGEVGTREVQTCQIDSQCLSSLQCRQEHKTEIINRLFVGIETENTSSHIE